MKRMLFHPIFSRGNVLLLAGAFLVNACSSPTTSTDGGEKRAHLSIENRTDYSWALTFTQDDRVKVAARVAPRQSKEIGLSAGTYQISQNVEGSPDAPHLSHALIERFDAGRTYRWPLVTLLSDATASSP